MGNAQDGGGAASPPPGDDAGGATSTQRQMGELQLKIQAEVDDALDRLDRQRLRPLSVKAFEGMADCARDANSDRAALDACMERCSMPMRQGQQMVQAEVGSFQNRLQQGFQVCASDAEETIKNNPDQKAQAEAAFAACCAGSAGKHLANFPQTAKRLDEELAELAKGQ